MKPETRRPVRLLQNSVAADVSRRKHLKLARTNVRGYEVLKKPRLFENSELAAGYRQNQQARRLRYD
jgi:hypothetical protein